MTIGSAQLAVPDVVGRRDRSAECDCGGRSEDCGRWCAVLRTSRRRSRLQDRAPGRPYRSATARKVIAVLDDDQDLTNSICTHLESSGYDARPFYKIADLLASVSAQSYDGYIVDWIVDETSVMKLIGALREKDPKSPIVVLTAQVLTGVVEEADIAEAVKRYDLTFHEKPVRTSILEATLARALAVVAPARSIS